MQTHTNLRMRRVARAMSLVALAMAAVGCDSMPDAIGPSAEDLLSTFTIWNNAPAPMTQVLVHPTSNFSWCPQPNEAGLPSGLATFSTAKGQGRDFNLPSGCYVFFARYEGRPGVVQLGAILGDDDHKSLTIPALPVPPTAGMIDGSVRITNNATTHSAAITRIYTDACQPNNPYYGIGPTGGVTTDNAVNVAKGAFVTIPVPRACHLITILWSNGAYQFGTYNITGANTLSATS